MCLGKQQNSKLCNKQLTQTMISKHGTRSEEYDYCAPRDKPNPVIWLVMRMPINYKLPHGQRINPQWGTIRNGCDRGLPYWDLNEITNFVETAFSKVFTLMNSFVWWFKFHLDILQGSFRLCNWLSLRRLVSWINHLPPACWSTFWKSNFKQQLRCRLDIMDNKSYFIFVFWHM